MVSSICGGEAQGAAYMTLVLGACTPDAVVLAADSKTHVCTIDPDREDVRFGEPITDRKLFKLARVGIATYGTARPGDRVPDVLSRELQMHWTVREVIEF